MAEGKTFGTFNIRRGILNPFREIDTGQIAISPDGKTIVFAADAEPAKAQGDRLGAPILRIGPLRSSGANDITIGQGTEPLFSPDGTQVAAIVPDRRDSCDPGQKGCPSETVMIYEAIAEPNEGTLVLEDGDWDIIGWTGSDVVVVSEEDGSLWRAGPKGASKIGRDGTNVLAVSPTESTVLIAVKKKVALLPIARVGEPGITGELIELALDDSAVTGAFWSPDGSKVAVVTDSVWVIDIEAVDGEGGGAAPVPTGIAASGQFAWAADSEHFIFSKLQKASERAMLCDASLGCDYIFSWDQGTVTLQGLL